MNNKIMKTLKEKEEIEIALKELKNIKSEHTNLISLYLSGECKIALLNRWLNHEIESTQKYIKNDNTRKDIRDALELINDKLKEYKEIPSNGLVFFIGNATDLPEKRIILCIEPSYSMFKIRQLYRCDNYFIIDILLKK